MAVSGLQPQGEAQQQQSYVGVPPPGSQQPPSTSFIQKARAPFMGLTVVATVAVAAWQSNRLYAKRQDSLLDEFSSTMVFHFGNDAEMARTLQSYRTQLGPGSYKGKMYGAFLLQMANVRSPPLHAPPVPPVPPVPSSR